jgi:t-SNARE complex subunit (syntaxin)
VDETLVQIDNNGPESPLQEQQQAQQLATAGPSLAEIEFQETLIAERETEIREIESGIHELNEIFRDLGHIVQEQGGMIGECITLTRNMPKADLLSLQTISNTMSQRSLRIQELPTES